MYTSTSISIPLNIWIALFKDGACSFLPLWDGEWYDSLHGDVNFNSSLSTVTGWAYTAYNQLVTPFTCVSENTTSNQLLFMWVVCGLWNFIFASLFRKRYLNYSDILTFVDDNIHHFSNINNYVPTTVHLIFALFSYFH